MLFIEEEDSAPGFLIDALQVISVISQNLPDDQKKNIKEDQVSGFALERKAFKTQ